MSSSTRAGGVALTGLVLAAALVALAPGAAPPPSARAQTQDAGALSLHTPAPAPGSVVRAGEVRIRAHIGSAEPIASFELRVDGEVARSAGLEHREAPWGTAVSAIVEVEAGEHTGRLDVEDEAGRTATRTWSFTATDRTTRRLAGEDRFATAVAVSVATHPERGDASAAVLARADDFADALAGAPLAHHLEGPLLLASADGLPATTAAELRRVLPEGATVHLLGGHGALGPEVAEAVESLGFRTSRHAGEDRFATAAVIARRLPRSAGVVVASGSSFPDALAASAPAARDGLPVLLTDADELPTATAEALAERRPAEATIVGGTEVVGEAVERDVRSITGSARRIGGADRYETGAAVLAAFYEVTPTVALASGSSFPDALAGAPHAAAGRLPLLLSDPGALSLPTAEALRTRQPMHIVVYGGASALAPHVEAAALRAAVDGPGGPRLLGSAPTSASTVDDLDSTTVQLDRAVDPAVTSVYVEVGGMELPGTLAADGATLTLQIAPSALEPAIDVRHRGRVVVAAAGPEGLGRHEIDFAFLRPDPIFASVGGIDLHLPSRVVEMIGYHESNHDGARELAPRDTATPTVTMSSRSRGNGAHTAADVVADPASPVLAPVTGRVLRAGSYVLYCRYTDEFAVMEADAHPGWEVKVLHVQGLQLEAGDRVEAGKTVLAAGPRPLPFRSQVDDHSQDRNWPHAHLEVVDPSIPAGGGGGGC